MKTISINNQKGGVGKTTTTIALASMLKEKGYRVLVVDCDGSSRTLTKLLTRENNISLDEIDTTLTDLILLKTMGRNVKDLAKVSIVDCNGIGLIPADSKLTTVTTMLGQQNDLEVRFKTIKNILDVLKDDFDYCLLDAAPVLDLLSHNELIASDEVIIVSQCQKASIDAINELLSNINSFVKPINPDLKIKGILFTMLDKRSKYGQEQLSALDTNINIFETVIPRGVVAERYLNSGIENVISKKNKVGEAYQNFIYEYFLNEQKKEV